MLTLDEILVQVRDGTISIVDAQKAIRGSVAEELSSSFVHARFHIELIAERDVPDGFSDVVSQPHAMVRSISEIKRNEIGDWCDREGNEIGQGALWVNGTKFGAQLAAWTTLNRDTVFGTRSEDVQVRVRVQAGPERIVD